MVQVPVLTKARVPSLVMVHTPVVLEVKVGASPEVAVALRVGVVPKFSAPGLAKDIVWLAFGVTLFEAAEAGPVPALLVVVTVKV